MTYQLTVPRVSNRLSPFPSFPLSRKFPSLLLTCVTETPAASRGRGQGAVCWHPAAVREADVAADSRSFSGPLGRLSLSPSLSPDLRVFASLDTASEGLWCLPLHLGFWVERICSHTGCGRTR